MLPVYLYNMLETAWNRSPIAMEIPALPMDNKSQSSSQTISLFNYLLLKQANNVGWWWWLEGRSYTLAQSCIVFFLPTRLP